MSLINHEFNTKRVSGHVVVVGGERHLEFTYVPETTNDGEPWNALSIAELLFGKEDGALILLAAKIPERLMVENLGLSAEIPDNFDERVSFARRIFAGDS